jgi:UDP-glucose 4-epimerase
MKILITGGAGFIGSNLTDRLIAAGHDVLVVDNFSTGRRDNLKTHPKLQLVELHIAEREALFKVFNSFKPQRVVHAAASYKNPDAWLEDCRTNIEGTANVVQACEATGVERILYYQTALQYGLKPIEQPITLNHPVLSGGSSYAISKTAAKQYLEMSKLDCISFILANAYGPRNISGPLPTFYQRLSEGKACFVMDTRRDFIFIDDLVDVSFKAIVEGKGVKGSYHIASGGDYSIKELFDATLHAMKIKPEKDVEVRPRSPDDAFTILLDPSKTFHDFGWKTTTPLEYGVSKAIQYYAEFGITETFTHLRLNKD